MRLRAIDQGILQQQTFYMNNLSISNGFTENINKNLLFRNFQLVKWCFFMSCIYAAFNLTDWYLLLQSKPAVFRTGSSFYFYRIQPVIALIMTIIHILGWSLLTKGNRLVIVSVENENADDFNAGYSLIYKCGILSLISFIISTISLAIRMLLKH